MDGDFLFRQSPNKINFQSHYSQPAKQELSLTKMAERVKYKEMERWTE
jgi:hypothetical protein